MPFVLFLTLGLLDRLPRWTMIRNTQLLISPEAGVAVISENYLLEYCLHACQHTSAIQCTAVVYAYADGMCKMYNATRNTRGATLTTINNVAYFELHQGRRQYIWILNKILHFLEWLSDYYLFLTETTDNGETTPLIFTSQRNTQPYVQLAASSHVTDFPPESAWLYDDFAWTATSTKNEWFTVSITDVIRISTVCV